MSSFLQFTYCRDIFHHTISFLLIRDIQKLWDALENSPEIEQYYAEQNIIHMPHIKKPKDLKPLNYNYKKALIELNNWEISVRNKVIYKIVYTGVFNTSRDFCNWHVCTCGLKCVDRIHVIAPLIFHSNSCSKKAHGPEGYVGKNFNKKIINELPFAHSSLYVFNLGLIHPSFSSLVFNCFVIKIYSDSKVLAYINAPLVQVIQFFLTSAGQLTEQCHSEPLYKLKFPRAQFEYYLNGEKYTPPSIFIEDEI